MYQNNYLPSPAIFFIKCGITTFQKYEIKIKNKDNLEIYENPGTEV